MEQRLVLIDKVSIPQYAEESPLLLEACALYLDNASGQYISQLKWKNISQQTINAVMIDLLCSDAFGHVVKTVAYQYDRFDLARGQTGGGKTAIPLGRDKIVKYEVCLKAVSFADGTVQEYSTALAYVRLPEETACTLTNDLLAQFKRDLAQQNIKASVRVEVQSAAGLWQCICGSWQVEGEACLVCGAQKADLLATANQQSLEQHLEEYNAEQARLKEEARIARERAEAERRQKLEEEARRREQERQEAEARAAAARKKRNKVISIMLSSAAVVTAVVCAIIFYFIPNSKYDAAVALKNEGKYEEAIVAFMEIETYKDSTAQIEACKTAILDGKYDAAVALMEAGRYVEAIIAFTEIIDYKDSSEQKKACETVILDEKYVAAVTLMNNGNYSKAYDAFLELAGHRDSQAKATAIREKAMAERRANAKIGDYIIFGTYEQDNNRGNGKEEIEWLVLAKEDNRLLVISKYMLDADCYHYTRGDVTWATCSLRKWLNSDFLNQAFTSTEKELIPVVTVPADKNPKYSTHPGSMTQDRVFLLSVNEVNKYFKSNESRICEATPFALAQEKLSPYAWWLRSPGDNQEEAAQVDYKGNFSQNYACTLNGKIYYGVRPALWIDLGE